MAAEARRNVKDILEVMMFEDSDSSDSDLEMALFDSLFLKKKLYSRRLNLEDISEAQCEEMFRFGKGHIERLGEALQLPDYYICSQGTKVSGIEALMILLRRFTYPNRLCDLEQTFGRQTSEMSLIINRILDDICERHGHLLQSTDLPWLDLEKFSNAIHTKGAPLDQCWGFIDGTCRPIARPIRNQRIMYSGHKRLHVLKFQSVQAPNGLIVHLFGPLEGRRHDAFMLHASGLSEKIQPFQRQNGDPYILYGDGGYGISQNIMRPFQGAHLTADEKCFNTQMSKVRICVEWGFGKITQNFAFLDFKKNQKVLLQPVGKYYIVGAILINCHTCLYGSVTGTYFNLQPPTLETYLSNN